MVMNDDTWVLVAQLRQTEQEDACEHIQQVIQGEAQHQAVKQSSWEETLV